MSDVPDPTVIHAFERCAGVERYFLSVKPFPLSGCLPYLDMVRTHDMCSCVLVESMNCECDAAERYAGGWIW